MRETADNIVRILVGLLFIFSGLIKVNDPLGTAIKFKEYFDVFASDFAAFFEHLIPLSLAFSVVFVVLEVVLGAALLLKYRMRITVWFLLLLIIFFSFLTFYSAQFDKVTDCGCFGDAIPLSPWQSFVKDVILLILVGYLFIRKNTFQPLVPQRRGDIFMVAITLFCTFLAIYALEHLPYIDFRAYSVGTDIEKAMKPSETLQYRYIMRKDGALMEFDQYPTDTSYEFVEMELLNPEAQARITDYSLWNDDGEVTQQSFEGNKLLVIFYDVTKAETDNIDEIMALARSLGERVETWAVTSNDEATYEDFRHEYQIALPYYYIDGTVAEAMIRANPGLFLMRDGVVLAKWHNNDVPDREEVLQLISAGP